MFYSRRKTIIIYIMTLINSVAGYIFLYYFLKIFKQFEFQPYHEDYGDYEVSKTTIMIHNIPPHIPVIECNTLLGQIFKSRFGKDLEAVHTVGKYDKVRLDKYYDKRNWIEDKLEYYSEKKIKNHGREDRITVYNKGF